MPECSLSLALVLLEKMKKNKNLVTKLGEIRDVCIIGVGWDVETKASVMLVVCDPYDQRAKEIIRHLVWNPSKTEPALPVLVGYREDK